ncbi:ISL3 family transposase, partial [Salmonella enterica]
TLRTGADLLTKRQDHKLQPVFTAYEHVEVEATWRIYQKIVTAYRCLSKPTGKQILTEVIAALRRGGPAR